MKVKKEFDVKLGERIRKIREQKDIRVWYIAEKTGLSDTFIYQVERGEKGISAENLGKLSEALGVSVDYLIFGNVNRDSNDEFLKLFGKFNDTEKNFILKLMKTMDEED